MFMEDLNMPQKEEYGAQPPLEFLRQFISNDGFYDVSRYSWKVIERSEGDRELFQPICARNICSL